MSDFDKALFRFSGAVSRVYSGLNANEANERITGLTVGFTESMQECQLSARHERVAASFLRKLYSAVQNDQMLSDDETVMNSFNEVLNEVVAPENQIASQLLKTTVEGLKSAENMPYKAAARFNAIREQLRNMTKPASDVVNNPKGINYSSDVINEMSSDVTEISEKLTVSNNTLDTTIVGEIAKAALYIDDPAFSEAAATTELSIREYCAGLALAYENAGGDLESEQYRFLKSIADNPYFNDFIVDDMGFIGTDEGGAVIISVSNASGHGTVGIYTDMTEKDYSSGTSEFSKVESLIGGAMSKAVSRYDTFDIVGVGNGGNAAVMAAMQLDEKALSGLIRVITVDSDGFSQQYLNNHINQAANIADRTGNFISMSKDMSVTNAADYLTNAGGAYVGFESYVASADESESEPSWMAWEANDDGEFDVEYSYNNNDAGFKSQTGAGGSSGSGSSYAGGYASGSSDGQQSGNVGIGSGSSVSAGAFASEFYDDETDKYSNAASDDNDYAGTESAGSLFQQPTPELEFTGDRSSADDQSETGENSGSSGNASSNNGVAAEPIGGSSVVGQSSNSTDSSQGKKYSRDLKSTGGNVTNYNSRSNGKNEIEYNDAETKKCANAIDGVIRVLNDSKKSMETALESAASVWSCTSATTLLINIKNNGLEVGMQGIIDATTQIRTRLYVSDENYIKVEKINKSRTEDINALFD